MWRPAAVANGYGVCSPPVLKEVWKSMTRAYKIVIERDTQGGYVATFPEMVGRQAQAGSLKTLMERIREAAALGPEGSEPVAIRHPLVPDSEPKAGSG
jgi:predicted RNase H-like HicB family nuclease